MNTTKNVDAPPKGKGRPKHFDRKDALDQALRVFCSKGYEAASVALLGEAMNMKPPSLYNAFGDKERLFIEVLEHYHRPYEEALTRIFSERDDTRQAIQNLMDLSKQFHGGVNAIGCLVVNSSINVKAEASPVAQKIKVLHDKNEALIRGRLERGQHEGDIPQDVDVVGLARYVNGLLQGVAVLARGQQSPEAVNDLLVLGMQGFVRLIDRT